jgi:diguanylate cyclase (GGDEF)-like protein
MSRWVAIAFLDVDCFQAINDTYGHAAGNAVAREFGRRLPGGPAGGRRSIVQEIS